MSEYMYYMLFSVGVVSGLITGIAAGLWTVSDFEHTPTGRHEKQKPSKKKRQLRFTNKGSREDDSRDGILKQRIAVEKSSWTEFTCSADCVDEKEYIEKSRKNEERAYRYAKRRSRKRH